MKRGDFLKTLALLPLSTSAMQLKELSKLSAAFAATPKMPVLFLGHGSPMNAIEENEFVAGLEKLHPQFQNPMPYCAFRHIGKPAALL